MNNGRFSLWIDGVRKANLALIDNDTHRIDQIRLGPVGGIDIGTRGQYFLDDFLSRRDNVGIGP